MPLTADGLPEFVDSGQQLGNDNGTSAAFGDLDGDGDLDAFVANSHRGNQIWLNSAGVFQDSGQRLGDRNSKDVALGDFDGDGDLDAFVANDRQSNQIWWNDGGQFLGESLPGTANSIGVDIGDLDGDGDLDAYVANRGQGNRVWWNQDGTFVDSGQLLGSGNSYAVALADVDADGDLDAFVANFVQSNRVWLNEGGQFGDSGQSLGLRNSFDVSLGDLDSDGDQDAIVANFFQGNSIWWNDNGSFRDSGQSLGRRATSGVALGDFDRDGALDAMFANAFQPNSIWLNRDGEFVAGPQEMARRSSSDVTLGDVDEDGDLDALVINGLDHNRLWLDPSVPTALSLEATDPVLNESEASENPFVITVSRSGDTSSTTAVFYSVSGVGERPADETDFGGTLPRGLVTFAAGETTQTIEILVEDDTVVEENEQFLVALGTTTPSNVLIVSPAVEVTIVDDDQFGFRNVVADVPEDADTTSSLRVADLVAIDEYEFELSGADADRFFVQDSQLLLKDGVELDFENQPELHVSVDLVRASEEIPQPHRQRVSTNRFPDGSVEQPFHWQLSAVSFDIESRTDDGSGSWRLERPFGTSNYSQVLSPPIEVHESGSYTYGFFVKANTAPNLFAAQLKLYDGNGRFLRNTAGISFGGVSGPDEWEEAVNSIYIDATESPFVRLHVLKSANPTGPGHLLVDDFYFGLGEATFEQPPPTRTGFEGSRVQVDELGNFTVGDNSFFPWMLHVDGARKNIELYADQGWNTNIWASTDEVVQNYADAGMYSMFQLAHYTNTGARLYNDLTTLTDRLGKIAANGNLDSVIGYYWDNERSHDEWQVPIDVISAVREIDGEAPVYALQGSVHVARTHAAAGLVDVSGAYVSGAPDALTVAGTTSFRVLNNIEGNNRPSPIAQINSANSHPGELRLRVYNALIEGARGIGYYGDRLSDNPSIEDAIWAADMPALPNEISQALDILRTPHWTPWQVTSSNHAVRVGSRDLSGTGYLIVVNQTTETQQVSLDIPELPYSAASLRNVLSDQTEAAFDGDTVTLTIPPIGIGSGTAIFEIVGAHEPRQHLGDLFLQVTDVNERPELEVRNVTPEILETMDRPSDLPVAEIIVNDDALGSNLVSLSGADADSFVVNDGQLLLRASTSLSAELNPTLEVTIQVDDESIEGVPDAERHLVILVTPDDARGDGFSSLSVVSLDSITNSSQTPVTIPERHLPRLWDFDVDMVGMAAANSDASDAVGSTSHGLDVADLDDFFGAVESSDLLRILASL